METITIEDRKKILVIGATKMLSSTNTQAVVEMSDCNLVISGKNIEITKLNLDNKEVSFSGEISAVRYANKTEKTNIIKRLFK